MEKETRWNSGAPMTDKERQKLCDWLRHLPAYLSEDGMQAADEIERLAALVQSDAEPHDPLPREHQDPSKWISRETMEVRAIIQRVSEAVTKQYKPGDKITDITLPYKDIDMLIEAALAQSDAEPRCPRCGSSDPARHPAVQFEGEVQICPHPFHSSQSDAEPRPDASAGLTEAAEWLDRQAMYHEQNASDEPNDAKPEMTEGDCSKAISGYLRKAAHNIRARAAEPYCGKNINAESEWLKGEYIPIGGAGNGA